MSFSSLNRSPFNARIVRAVKESSPVVYLHSGEHKRVSKGHPWIYSNEVKTDETTKLIEPGTIVRFCTNDGTPLGIGSFNPRTLICGRIFARDGVEKIDREWFRARIKNALNVRGRFFSEPYYRLVHSEADGLPGLVIDRFDRCLSVQLNTAGMQRLWEEIEASLVDLLNPETIILHNDSRVRELEGLNREVTVARGAIDQPIEVHENGLVYFADLIKGQKTGWYYDQRENRALLAKQAEKCRVLDVYCYSGGFGLLLAKAGASEVIGIDASETALTLAKKAAERNGVDGKTIWINGNAFEELERMEKNAEKFDIVIADPPPFVKSRKEFASGARGYRKLARLASGIIKSGGLLFIFSCSYNMGLDDFAREVGRGLHEAGREGRFLRTVFASPDHPVHPQLPESGYLKGILVMLD